MIQPFSIGFIFGLVGQLGLFLDAECYVWNILDALNVEKWGRSDHIRRYSQAYFRKSKIYIFLAKNVFNN